ncbi:hypothetical protein Pmani_020053 [Petrolisthes manimaculis]|uniref:Uncharacterized protein n=1 Tax=Petrolisthes manimaculis TaxID=1843537 RepID=A0AAE1PJJ1_9EUCA|nr:hypothetical protein Pmani_020053 [Petrolisthes manimaculis]
MNATAVTMWMWADHHLPLHLLSTLLHLLPLRWIFEVYGPHFGNHIWTRQPTTRPPQITTTRPSQNNHNSTHSNTHNSTLSNNHNNNSSERDNNNSLDLRKYHHHHSIHLLFHLVVSCGASKSWWKRVDWWN